MTLRSLIVRAAVVLSVASVAVAAANTSPAQAEAFASKIAVINQHAELGSRTPRRTALTEGELNSWFVHRAQPLLPEGVTSPRVTIVGSGKLLGSAVVDLEAVGKRRGTGGSLDLWSYLGGRVPLSVTGILHTQNGKGRFELQAADISGVPVPRALLQELLSYYTRSPERPQGLRLDDPFDLPAAITRIEVGQGQAVVVQ